MGSNDTAFQFLIGRLETRSRTLKRNSAPVFQFLIGRLETIAEVVADLWEKGFQFLIGRLETDRLPAGKLLKIRFNSS